MKITVQENMLSVEQYLAIRQQVGWKKLEKEQAQKALKNSLYVVAAYDENSLVGIGRVVGDGAVICYVQDLIVIPTYQGSGIGSLILNKLSEYVQSIKLQESEMMFCLMCAKGRESFYEKHGFIARPTENLGPGMIQYYK